MPQIVDRVPDHLVDVPLDVEAARLDVGTGCSVRTDEPGDHCPLFGEAFREQVIPRSEWKAAIESRQLDYSRDKSWQYNQLQEGTCFPAGTLVRMSDGTQKPIESISITESVLTAEGNIGRVVRIQRRHAEGLMRLIVRGHRHLKATAEHPVLTRRGYIRMDELKIGDEVKIPRWLPESESVIQTSQFIERRAFVSSAAGRRRYHIPGKAPAVVTYTHVPDAINMDADFGRAIGYFLAEGSTCKTKVVFTFSTDEEHTLVADCCRRLEAIGGTPRLQFRRCNNSINVILYGVQWSQLFASLCGTRAGGKRLHPTIAAGPREFLREVWEGWALGDGMFRRNGRRQVVTVSHELAMNMYDIANAIGVRPVISTKPPRINAAAKTRQDCWFVETASEDTPNKYGFKADVDVDATWRPVSGVEEEEFSGWVYNIEVEGDHSYVAEGIGVHNCTANALSGCVSYTWNRKYGKANAIAPAPISVYKFCARGPNTGSSTSCILRRARDNGLLLIDTAENKRVLEALGLDTRHVLKATGYSQPFPSGWAETAAEFRVQEYYEITNIDGFFTALLLGFDVLYGRAGHAIHGVDVVWDGKRFLCKYDNSWGNWGDHGFGYDSLDFLVRNSAQYGAYAVKSLVDPKGSAKLVDAPVLVV